MKYAILIIVTILTSCKTRKVELQKETIQENKIEAAKIVINTDLFSESKLDKTAFDYYKITLPNGVVKERYSNKIDKSTYKHIEQKKILKETKITYKTHTTYKTKTTESKESNLYLYLGLFFILCLFIYFYLKY